MALFRALAGRRSPEMEGIGEPVVLLLGRKLVSPWARVPVAPGSAAGAELAVAEASTKLLRRSLASPLADGTAKYVIGQAMNRTLQFEVSSVARW